MITYERTSSGNEFVFIDKPGVYKARLAVVLTSHQDEKFAKNDKGEPVTPKQLISFVWDVLNANGKNVHIHTKPCTISFTDKSNLRDMWSMVTTLDSFDDFLAFFYDGDKLKDFNADVAVAVEEKDGKIYNKVKQVLALYDTTEVPVSPINDFDLRTYGRPCDEYDLTPSYAN